MQWVRTSRIYVPGLEYTQHVGPQSTCSISRQQDPTSEIESGRHSVRRRAFSTRVLAGRSMRCCCCPISFFISRGHHVALATGIFLALYTAKIGRTHVHVRCWLARCSSPGIFFQFYSVFVQTVKASSYLFFRIVRPRVKIWAPCASQCVALFHPLRIVRTAHFRILKIKSNKAPSIRRQSSLAPPNWTAPVVVNLEIG
jgi:hypothetical protein